MKLDSSNTLLYDQIAEYIADLIDIGTLRPGDRVPSLRKVSVQKDVSISTALHAYRLLEDRGVIEARPKSGYFVRQPAAIKLAMPSPTRNPVRARPVTISDTFLDLMNNASDPDMAPLGCAIPSTDLLAANHLDRFLSRAARQRGRQYNVYSTPQGEPVLRHAIAKRAIGQGWVLGMDDIAVTSGCTEALLLALKAVTKPGDSVIVESPTYFGILHILKSLQLNVLELPASPVSGIDLAILKNTLQTHQVAACLLSSSFNNPLGFSVNDDIKRQILEILAKAQVTLIEDDIYGELYFSGERPKPFCAFESDTDIIYCSSFSKTIAPGYRVGWMVPGNHMKSVLENKMAQSLCCPVLPQIAIANYLSVGGYDNHLRRIRRALQSNIREMCYAIKRSFPDSTKVTVPEGGFVLWLELEETVDTRVLLESALKQGICFAPGVVFSSSGDFVHCMRLSCGHQWDAAIDSAVDSLGGLIKQTFS